MRAIWKGHIRFSLVTIPVQIYSAIESKGNISFKQLHDHDNGRISYKKVCKSCKEEVPYKNIVKGYEYEDDQYVVFTKKELEAIKLDSTRTIDIEAFVDISEVHPSRYESVSFIGPNGEVAHATYALLRDTLAQTQKAGIGRIILRDREDVVLLAPYDNGIIMYKLRYPYELRDIKNVPELPETIELDQAQVELAKTLVSTMEKDFTEIDFSDRYRIALDDLVQDKIAGKEIISMEDDAAPSVPVVDIMSVLKESVEKAKSLKKGA